MPRYFLEIMYDGGAYHGWQRQPQSISVQQVLEEALAILVRHECPVVGAGRTDTGVHASGQHAHFDTDTALQPDFLRRLNGILPYQIAAKGLYEAARPEVHARFTATSRAYIYTISRRKNPFLFQQAWTYTGPLDLDRMQQATALLLGYTDFASFCKAGSDEQTTLCGLHHAHWVVEEDLWRLHIQANRFLRGMVRGIVGTLVEVGKGQRSLEQFTSLIEGKDRTLAGVNAPPHGLCLVGVTYPEGALKKFAQIL